MTTAELERPAIREVAAPADDVATLFPTARRSDEAVTHPLRRRGSSFDMRASPTAWIVGEGLESLGDLDRRRVVDGWRHRPRDRDAALVVDSGCDVRVGRVPLGAAARAGLLRWLPLSRLELALCDGGLFADEPARAIALLVRPPTIWTAADAVAIVRRFPHSPRFDPERFAAIEACAGSLVGSEHRGRVRAAVSRIDAQLPVGGHPVASRIVAAGCAAVAGDDDRCTAVAARQLARYASSARAAALAGRS